MRNESKEVVDDFAEGLNERIRSTVGEFLSTVGRLQAEQQKQVQEFHVLHIFYAGMCSLLLLAVGADVRAYGTQLPLNNVLKQNQPNDNQELTAPVATIKS
ncbi:hypothetical protein Tco_0931337 [Tanacetum coccineum]